MYLNKYLKPGDFVTLIPVGVRLTLQYNVSGFLEKVYVGYDTDKREVPDSTLSLLNSNHLIPTHISITSGTTWVYGVLYTGYRPKTNGQLPDCVESELMERFVAQPNTFAFYAGHIKSTSIPILGAMQIRQYLKLSRFNVLPGWFVPGYVDDSVPNSWLSDPAYTFNSVVTNLFIVSGNSTEIVSTKLSQYQVTDVKEIINKYGHYRIVVSIITDSGIKELEYRYTEALKYNICKDCIIYVEDYELVDTYSAVTASYPLFKHCPCCGKSFTVDLSEYEVLCPDVHCASKLIPLIEQFIDVLGLPYPAESFKSYINSHDILCIPDIFTLESYESMTVETTLAKLLRAIIPYNVVPNNGLITDFARACGSKDSVLYYASHTSDIVADLHISGDGITRLMAWFDDDCNLSDLQNLLTLPQITIVAPNKRFEGAPILLNKTICITGKFIHGPIGDIIDIIESYSGKVSTKFDSNTDLVLVGSTNEDVSGAIINAARNICVPIWDELAFFERFDIDSDIQTISR